MEQATRAMLRHPFLPGKPSTTNAEDPKSETDPQNILGFTVLNKDVAVRFFEGYKLLVLAQEAPVSEGGRFEPFT